MTKNTHTAEAAQARNAFNIPNDIWDATPQRVRKKLIELATNPAPVLVTVRGGVAETLSATNQTVTVYDFDNNPDMEEKFETDIAKHTKKYHLT